MTLPTTNPLSGNDDDSDMFGPPRSSPVGYHQRSRVPMISPKLRQREERKRILQLCAHKLERIKDSEANLRRSVCINNTYSRLTDEVRREKQSRYLANLPKSDTKPETAHDNIYSPYSHHYTNQMELRNESYHKINHHSPHHHNVQESFNNNSLHSSNQKHKISPIAHTSSLSSTTCSTTSSHNSTSSLLSSSNGGLGDTGGSMHSFSPTSSSSAFTCGYSSPASYTSSSSLTTLSPSSSQNSATTLTSSPLSTSTITSASTYSTTSLISSSTTTSSSTTKSSSNVDADLEILDRELNAINASMPLIDPEITQGAEQLEKAVSSRKRSRTEEENDRLVREALSQFYLPTQRVISALDDYPGEIKRTKFSSHCNGLGSMSSSCHNSSSNSIGDLDLDLGLDMSSHHHHHHHPLHHHHHHHHHQSQKEFEVIMDALRLSTGSPTPSAQDSCGQAAMMSESGVFHNLVVTSLET